MKQTETYVQIVPVLEKVDGCYIMTVTHTSVQKTETSLTHGYDDKNNP